MTASFWRNTAAFTYSEAMIRRALPAGTFLFSLLTAKGYGYFRDELYYLACGEHLDFGYVDHPPLIAVMAAAVRALLGESLVAIRLLPAVAAALTVWLAGLIARELGGGRFAQLLAAAATTLAPAYLALFSFLSMNAFDVVFWIASCWLLARMLRTGNERYWAAFGVVAGLGLENKISILFLGFGLAVGLVLSRRWEVFRSRWLWLGGGLAAVVFLPHLLWQAFHGWPTLEFMENARSLKMLPLAPPAFLQEQILLAGPAALPIWLSGAGFFLFAHRGRPYGIFGWTYLAILGLMMGTGAKPYYLAPIYTVLYAGGGVAIEAWTFRPRAKLLRPAILIILIAGGALAAPLAKPLLPVDTYLRYASWLGFQASSGERHKLGRLPQHFADMHGWPELAETVARVYRELPEEDRSGACIFAQNYGQAGAIDLFGPHLGLPKAISAHNSYFLWGPRQCTGDVLVVIGDERERLEELFQSVERAATYRCRDCMPYEDNKPIWVARGLREPVKKLWPGIKRYI